MDWKYRFLCMFGLKIYRFMWMLLFKIEWVNKVYVYNCEEIMRDLLNVISDKKKKDSLFF